MLFASRPSKHILASPFVRASPADELFVAVIDVINVIINVIIIVIMMMIIITIIIIIIIDDRIICITNVRGLFDIMI